VQVPGCPTCGWVWSDDNAPGNQRGGRWVPDNYPPTPGGHPWGELGSRFEGWPRALDIDDGRGRKNGGGRALLSRWQTNARGRCASARMEASLDEEHCYRCWGWCRWIRHLPRCPHVTVNVSPALADHPT
jgi:hypothetical protein